MTEKQDVLSFQVEEDFVFPKFPDVPVLGNPWTDFFVWGATIWSGVMVLTGLFYLDMMMVGFGLFLAAIMFGVHKFRRWVKAEKLDDWRVLMEQMWKLDSEFLRLKNMFVLSGLEDGKAMLLASHALGAWREKTNKYVSFYLKEGKHVEGNTFVQIYYEPKHYRSLNVIMKMEVPGFV